MMIKDEILSNIILNKRQLKIHSKLNHSNNSFQSIKLMDNENKTKLDQQNSVLITPATSCSSQDINSHFESSFSYPQEETNFMCISPIKPVQKISKILEKFSEKFIQDKINSSFLQSSRFTPCDLNETYQHLIKEEQNNFEPIYGYMQNQADLTEQMRAILIDWLTEVHFKFKLKQETLFLTVNIIDRYLVSNFISREFLQLLGITALFLACKYEEINIPEIKDLVYVTDSTYSEEQIINMERVILEAIKFNLTTPSINYFYEMLSVNFCLTEKEFKFGQYLSEMFLLDYRMNKYANSTIACAVIYLIMKVNKIEYYNLVKHYHLEEESVMKECARQIDALSKNIQTCNLKATRNKYASEYESN